MNLTEMKSKRTQLIKNVVFIKLIPPPSCTMSQHETPYKSNVIINNRAVEEKCRVAQHLI
ncbi:hypothetical protein C0081_04400 [Cohaesibacter celericrescens]|uniref:Uncharacterized protein n=1 Tax=Cohaesibacter celericrescens TaxID=2067669 RepID=A0A2N5XV01_9HYPH|nr:hypothetical protein C0081_04400 [Cohaesibacter celericrescens]